MAKTENTNSPVLSFNQLQPHLAFILCLLFVRAFEWVATRILLIERANGREFAVDAWRPVSPESDRRRT